jgi:hypothetical protein
VKILCLFVRHGTSAYPDSLAVLDQWYQNQGLLGQRTLWILDNALAPETPPHSPQPRVVLRAGDNLAWEFSTWERALAEARAGGGNYDVVHFVTSAFNTLYTEYLTHFSPSMLEYVMERNVCLGHIDGYNLPVRLGTTRSQAWIRTCFFFVPWRSVSAIPSWAVHQDPAVLFVQPDSRQFQADAPIDRDYQASITAWLQGDEVGGHTWHTPVNSGSMENIRFQRKTLAILNEHQLAITLRQAGILLVDFCWLYSFRTTPVSIISDPPAEVDQMKIRRKLLGFLEPSPSPDRLQSC